MTDETSSKHAFHIGLAMSGAASAGAYTAGVFDFLIEALSEWQKAKDKKDPGVPTHDVFISTLAGTSAGGITASLGLMSLAGGVRSVEEPSANPTGSPIKRVLPELYNMWVKDLRMFDTRDASKSETLTGNYALLDTGDIKNGSMPNSLLNSDTLTRVARQSLRSISPNLQPLPFFTNPTHLYLTRANLDGAPSSVGFGNEQFFLKLYEGRAHYAISGLSDRKFPDHTCTWLDRCSDSGMPIDASKLPYGQLEEGTSQREPEDPFEPLVQATLATSAIPVVFAARTIKNPIKVDTFIAAINLLHVRMGHGDDDGQDIKEPRGPRVQLEWRNSICTDGGSFNNDPFEIVRWTIHDLAAEENNKRDPEKSERVEEKNKRHAKDADRAVIMISPFPIAELPGSQDHIGSAEVLEVFNIAKVGKVASCKVTWGKVERGSSVRLLRDDVVIHLSKLSTLKRFKDDVKDVADGQECSMAFEDDYDIRQGDEIACFTTETIERAKEQDEPLKSQGPDISLRSVVWKLLGAYLDHAKFKALDLAAASDNNVYSRFLVRPKHLHPDREKEREAYETDKTKGKAKREFPLLATAALGHAAGFFDEQFSEHDFQLGRHNCQLFLQSGFKLHKDNDLYRNEMKNTNDEYYQLVSNELFADMSLTTPFGMMPPDRDYRPIIPLVGSMRDPIKLQPWPQMSRAKLPEMHTAFQHRFDHLAAATIADTFKSSWLMRTGARLAWSARRRQIVQGGVGYIINQLEKAKQIEPVPQQPGFWQRSSTWVMLLLLAAALIAVAVWLKFVLP